MQPYAHAALEQAEAALGENLVWLADQLDLKVRQKDAETLFKLDQLNAAWGAIVRALKVANQTVQPSLASIEMATAIAAQFIPERGAKQDALARAIYRTHCPVEV